MDVDLGRDFGHVHHGPTRKTGGDTIDGAECLVVRPDNGNGDGTADQIRPTNPPTLVEQQRVLTLDEPS